MQVSATNAAGLTGHASAPAVLILAESDSLSSVAISFIVAGAIIAAAIFAFVVVYYFARRRWVDDTLQVLLFACDPSCQAA